MRLAKICESMLDTLLSPNISRTGNYIFKLMRVEGKGCDNMTVIIIDFKIGF